MTDRSWSIPAIQLPSVKGPLLASVQIPKFSGNKTPMPGFQGVNNSGTQPGQLRLERRILRAEFSEGLPEACN